MGSESCDPDAAFSCDARVAQVRKDEPAGLPCAICAALLEPDDLRGGYAMHLVTYDRGQGPRAGVLDKDVVIDIAALKSGLPSDMLAVIEKGAAGLAEVKAALGSAKERIPVSSVKLMAPIPKPHRNIFCVGRNYYDHIREMHGDAAAQQKEASEFPVVFSKAPQCVIGPGDVVPGHYDYTNTLDYEGELAVIIGKPGRNIAKENAFDHVYGYSIFNDVTARTIQRQHQQWLLGKSIDGFGPMGPAIVTADEIENVKELRLRTLLNGEERQNSKVELMIFDIPTILYTISRSMQLLPGDIIATGTPSGVGQGFKPPRLMKKGDEVVVIIDKLGELRNTIG
jgi:2-keto-4-pentenoate hydratase/2-oxohepta-3-ene-1,7-dioic acid hydratase in catechol pathway